MSNYIGRKNQEKFLSICIVILYALMLLWTLSTCVESHIDSAIVSLNTDYIKSNSDLAFRVESIDTDGTLHLSDSSVIYEDSIKEYIRVSPGSGTYYFKDEGIMVAEITKNSFNTQLLRLYILSVVMIFISILMIFIYSEKIQIIALWVLSLGIFIVTSYEIWYSTLILQGFNLPSWVLFLLEVITYTIITVVIQRNKDKLNIKRFL